MTYNEWRDELKGNLLSVSEEERRRVLDYYAEAYADRREAGYSEREVIAEFGAPYDAARRILAEREEELAPPRENQEEKKKAPPDSFFEEPREKEQEPPARGKASDGSMILFVLLCVLLWAPIFGIFMAGVGITIALAVFPVSMIAGGVTSLVASIAAIAGGEWISALSTLGLSLSLIGIGFLSVPLCVKGVQWMWRLVKKLFGFVKSLFSGRRRV